MYKIKIINKLAVGPSGPMNINFEPVHLMQGDMDGACGPYALMMCFLINTVVTREEATNIHNADGRSRLGKFRNRLLEFGSLCKDGTCSKNLEGLSDIFKDQLLATIIHDPQTRKLAQQCIECLDTNNPIILGINFQGGGGHWLTVIGYESYDGYLTKLLVLDPGQPAPNQGLWNVVIELFDRDANVINKGKYPSIYSVSDAHSMNIKVDDFVLIASI